MDDVITASIQEREQTGINSERQLLSSMQKCFLVFGEKQRIEKKRNTTITVVQMIERFAEIDFAQSADPITDDFIRTCLRIRAWLEKDFVKRTLMRGDELYGGQQTPFKGISKLQDYARLLAS